MNGSKLKRVVIDTNVIFMALYNTESKAGKIIQLTLQNKLELFSPDSVKEELRRTLKRELNLGDDKVEFVISSLPISWIDKEIYKNQLQNTKVMHKPDKPVEALAITLNCGILSADKHFKYRLDINKLLDELK